jgi:hypothetical protein
MSAHYSSPWISITVAICCLLLLIVQLWSEGWLENIHRKLRAVGELEFSPYADNSKSSVLKFGDRAQKNNFNFRNAQRSSQKQAAMEMAENSKRVNELRKSSTHPQKSTGSGESNKLSYHGSNDNGAQVDGEVKKVQEWSSVTKARPLIADSVFSAFSGLNMEQYDSQADCFKSKKSFWDDERARLNGYRNSSTLRKRSVYKLPPQCDDVHKNVASSNNHIVSGSWKTDCYHLNKPADEIQSWYNITTQTFPTIATSTAPIEDRKPRKVYYSIFGKFSLLSSLHTLHC